MDPLTSSYGEAAHPTLGLDRRARVRIRRQKQANRGMAIDLPRTSENAAAPLRAPTFPVSHRYTVHQITGSPFCHQVLRQRAHDIHGRYVGRSCCRRPYGSEQHRCGLHRQVAASPYHVVLGPLAHSMLGIHYAIHHSQTRRALRSSATPRSDLCAGVRARMHPVVHMRCA